LFEKTTLLKLAVTYLLGISLKLAGDSLTGRYDLPVRRTSDMTASQPD